MTNDTPVWVSYRIPLPGAAAPTILQLGPEAWVITWNGETLWDVYPTLDRAVARVAGWWMGH
jgi:hypothetical protein